MSIKIIGVMTGNSLDAVDVVLTDFEEKNIKDLASFSIEYPQKLKEDMLELRKQIASKKSEMVTFENDTFFNETLESYTVLVAKAINALCENASIKKEEIAAIGFHGQTCDHFPPSIAKTELSYTLQIADAKRLAELTELPVIYDFRSDDLMNGGEAAPLAPVHNLHIAQDLKDKDVFPVAFCNAGNTGNIAVISETRDKKSIVNGWDTGPFNHFADMLVRTYKNQSCDLDGVFGKEGKINIALLEKLFNAVAVTNEGENFFLQPPPKSSDPSWYRLNPETICKEFGFEDCLRTVEYLSAYAYFHTLSFVKEDVRMPESFLLFGGGWKNPLILEDFKNLLTGNAPVLEQHKTLFEAIRKRFTKTPVVQWSDYFGYSGAYMEARIFADMAYCRIIGEPFSFPESTGCKTPTIAGIYVLPKQQKASLLEKLFEKYQTKDLIKNDWDKKWNRASKGWQKE